MRKLTNDKLHRITSLVVDTENKMRKIIETPQIGNMYFLYPAIVMVVSY